MKNLIKTTNTLCITLLAILFFACNDNICDLNDKEYTNIESKDIDPKYQNDLIPVKVGSLDRFLNDENAIFIDENGIETRGGYLVKDSLWPGGKGHSMIYETNEFLLTPDVYRYIYCGSLISGNSISSQKYITVPGNLAECEPITVSYSFPGRWVVDYIEVPSLGAQRNSVNKMLVESGTTGQQIVSFSYDMNQFTYYDELKIVFGSNINVASILNIGMDVAKGKIRSKTGLIAKFIQKNFTMDMDLPRDGCVLLDNNSLAAISSYDPVYIASIAFGRMGIVTIESDYNYDELRVAVQAAFQAVIVNGQLQISNEHQNVLTNSTLKITIFSGSGDGAVRTVEGFEQFKQFITSGGTYSPNNPGDPIFYTASHVSNNAPLYSRFQVDLAY